MQTEEIEELFRELKRSFEVGTIDEEELQAETNNLFFQDGEGNYRTLGAGTEKWYRFDDGDWAHASPPPTEIPRGAFPGSVVVTPLTIRTTGTSQ